MSTIDYKGFIAKLSCDQRDVPAVPLKAPQETELLAAPRAQVAGSPLASKLETTAERAIDKIDEIMAIPLDPENSQYGVVLRAQNAAANTALTTQVRVDENRLRAKSPDVLPELLKRIADEEAKLAQLNEKDGLKK